MTTDDTFSGQNTEPTVEDFDPAAWLSGATGTQRSVTIYGRGDLIAEVDELDRQARLARDAPDTDRALGDSTPESLEERRDALYAEFEASAVNVRVQGRSEAWLLAIQKRLKKAGIAADDKTGEWTLHYLAEAIVTPKGIDVAWLRQFREMSESQYNRLVQAFIAACGAPPAVTLPFSRSGSQARTRGTSS